MANTTWRKLSLGEVVTLQRGYDLPNKERKPGTVPIISSSGRIDMHNESRVAGPGVVTGRYGTIGEVFFISEDFWPLNTTLFVKDFKGNDPLFISFLLRTIDYQTYSGKSGVPGVNRNDLHEISVCLSPLPEQRAIATVLSDVDALIESLDRLIAKKRDIKQAAMQQLLTGRTRLPGFSGELKQGYKQTEAGLIPEDWEVTKLGKVADVKTGPFGSAFHEKDYVDDGTPIITVEHLGEQGIVYMNLPMVSDSDKKRLSTYSLLEGDIVFSRVGSVDRNALVKEKESGWLFSGRLLRIRLKISAICSSYLSYYFNQEQTKQRIRAVAVGQTMASLNTQILRNIDIAFPPTNSEQRVIAAILSDMDAEIVTLERKREKVRALKQGMMQELLTGKTRLL
jgi:type I restriction enzyme S subunit